MRQATRELIKYVQVQLKEYLNEFYPNHLFIGCCSGYNHSPLTNFRHWSMCPLICCIVFLKFSVLLVVIWSFFLMFWKKFINKHIKHSILFWSITVERIIDPIQIVAGIRRIISKKECHPIILQLFSVIEEYFLKYLKF